MSKNESAFPSFDSVGEITQSKGGLSKREYVAALVLQGLLANTALANEYNAEFAVLMADRLLAELKRTK